MCEGTLIGSRPKYGGARHTSRVRSKTPRSICYSSIKLLLPPPPCSTQSQCLLPGAIPRLRKQLSAIASLHPSQQVLDILTKTFSFLLPLCGAGHLLSPSWSYLFFTYLRIDSLISLQSHHERWRFLHCSLLGSRYSTSNTIHLIASPIAWTIFKSTCSLDGRHSQPTRTHVALN